MTGSQKSARWIFAQLAQEYGVTESIVRDICGPIGRAPQENWLERVALMRSKLEMTGLSPVGNPLPVSVSISEDEEQTDEDKEIDEEEPVPELRSCMLCESFLDDDDEGEPLVHSEEDRTGVLCRKCGALMVR